MQKQQKPDIRLSPDVYVKTHNYALAGSNPACLYPVLYTGLRPFCFPSLLCLNQRPALALSLELYHVGKNAALMQQLCRRSLFCYCSIFEHHNLICTGNSAHAMINKDERRDVSIRKPRPSIRKQLADSKQAHQPEKGGGQNQEK